MEAVTMLFYTSHSSKAARGRLRAMRATARVVRASKQTGDLDGARGVASVDSQTWRRTVVRYALTEDTAT